MVRVFKNNQMEFPWKKKSITAEIAFVIAMPYFTLVFKKVER